MFKRGVTTDRRALLQGGLLIASATALPKWAGAVSGTSEKLIRKRIPSTGELIPAIGLGTNAFRTSDYEAISAVLKRMQELGGTVIDTAASYHDSEGIIGKALDDEHIRKSMFISTKVDSKEGMPAPGGVPLDTAVGEESVERSLMRLQTRRVDLLCAHHLGSVEVLMPLLLKLKKQGTVRYIGTTTIDVQEHAQLIECMQRYPLDFIEVDYSLGNRDAAEKVFPVARARKIAVLVAEPLGGNKAPGAKPLMNQIGQRQLPSLAAEIGATSWSQFFLKYVISHPDVTCAIPGATKLEHLEDNQQAGRGRLPNAALRKRMEAFWDNPAST